MKKEYERPAVEFINIAGNIITESEHDNSYGDAGDFEDEDDWIVS